MGVAQTAGAEDHQQHTHTQRSSHLGGGERKEEDESEGRREEKGGRWRGEERNKERGDIKLLSFQNRNLHKHLFRDLCERSAPLKE